ncbi:MAG: PDZ domain-containing protein [Nannocystaceae bacterium]|nr:PDZ domain-containing protein [Nannocystaceae bacterium]
MCIRDRACGVPRDRRPLLWPVLFHVGWLIACDGAAAPPTQKSEAPAAAPVFEQPVMPTSPPGFDAALVRGIVLPSLDDGTYRVDPFVAVLIYERLRANLAPFAWVESEGPAPAGYRVGPLAPFDVFAKLGLEPGDIVEALGGAPLRTSEQRELALDAAENRLTVTIFREDLSFTNSYRFEGGLAWRDVVAGRASPRIESTSADPDPAQSEPNPPAKPGAPALPSVRKKRAAPTGPSSTPKKPRSRPPTQTSSDIRCTSGSACTLTQRKFDDLRASPSRLQRGVDIVPAIRNDVFSGYRLKRVTAGSPVHQLGFRAGDKVTHINGRDLTDDAQAMALYWSLGSSKVFKIRYERAGRKQVKTVRVV